MSRAPRARRAAGGASGHAIGAPPSRPALVALALLATAVSCMHAPGARGPYGAPPAPDSATILLWRMDEAAGDRAADAGGQRLHGIVGPDTDSAFGRYGNARVFNRSIESFVFRPFDPALESERALTIEAWIYLRTLGDYEDTPIACRWTEIPAEQSWLFAIVGQRREISLVPTPGYHRLLAQLGTAGYLMFTIQPQEAIPPATFFSTFRIELERWIHVAVSFDGELVRFFIDGRPNAQYNLAATIRPTRAPLLVGNYFDTRWISEFGGTVRVGGADRNPYYAFDGMIDELRISRVARAEFPTAGR